MTSTFALPDAAAILAGIPHPYLVLDRDLTIVAATDAYLALTDRVREDIVGRHILVAFPPDPVDVANVEQGPLEVSLRHVLATKAAHAMSVIRYDIPIPDRDGGGFMQRYWTPIHSPVIGSDGEVRFIVQDPSDVTEAFLKQQEADARLRIAMHAADLGSWEYEPETDLFRHSAAVDEMFGFAPGKGGPLAAPFFARMHPDDLPAVAAAVADTLERPDRTPVRFDYRILDADGGERHVASRGEVLRLSNGKARMIGVMMDVTAERRREADLSRSLAVQRDLLDQKDILLAEVNHRVKNSLQLVVSALSLQARRLTDPGAQTAFEGAIARVKAITSVHERLYRSANPLVVEMKGYLEAMSADLADSENRIDVEVEVRELPTERAIPVALIVNELVTNSLKYAYPDGRDGPIFLSLRTVEDGMLDLTVKDEGVGLAAQGSVDGLGTRLVKTMARQLFGTFESANEGGYRATVRFPEVVR